MQRSRPALVLAALVVLAATSSSVDGRAAADGQTSAAAAPQVLLKTGLRRPTALAFHPRDGSLWILNHADNSSAIVARPASPKRRVVHVVDTGPHYLWRPSGIAFARGGAEFATSQDVAGYRGFMGPTLWPGARSKFKPGTRLQGIHLDMLHHSPHALGIAAGLDETRREYWVFNGIEGSIDRYFFNEPHPPGANDHGDGLCVPLRARRPRRMKKFRLISRSIARRAISTSRTRATAGSRSSRRRPPPRRTHHRHRERRGRTSQPDDGHDGRDGRFPGRRGAHRPLRSGAAPGDARAGDHATGRIHAFRLDGTPVRRSTRGSAGTASPASRSVRAVGSTRSTPVAISWCACAQRLSPAPRTVKVRA